MALWNSARVSGVLHVADGSYHLCADFRKVNAITKSDSFLLPRVKDCIEYIGNFWYMSKFDLLKGY